MSVSGDASTEEGEPEVRNCVSCAHFFLTWQAQRRYGCRAMNFVSANLPCHDVLEIDGQQCMAYRARETHAAGQEENKQKERPGTKARAINFVV